MAGIQEYLDLIKNAVYGREVRQAIHDGIYQCYEDGRAGAIDLVAREEIAQLIAPSGEAPSAAEVTDARIGADGITYMSLGIANRTQISDLRNDLIVLANGSNMKKNIPMVQGGAIRISDGVLVDFSGVTTWAYSDFIEIPSYAITFETNAVSVSSTYGIAFYNANKEFIEGAVLGSNFKTEVQDGYRYARLTNYNANSVHNVNVMVTNRLGDSLDSFEKDVVALSDGGTKKLVPLTTGGGINASTGVAQNVSTTTWAYSDFIEIPDAASYFSSNCASPSSSFGVAFYNASKEFVEGYGNLYNPNIVIEDNYKYVRITNYNANSVHNNIFVALQPKNSIARMGIYNESNIDLAEVIDNATLIKGEYSLSSVITLKEGQNVIGSNCVIHVADGGQIRMANGSSISGIRFVGDWNPSRATGDGITWTSYGYVPLISMQDLYDENSDALFGDNKSYEDAVIFIPIADGAYNTKVDNCEFENFDRLAVFAGGGRHQDKTNPIVCNNYFKDCRMGIYVYGEFERIYANEYLRCIVGCYLYGGNSNNYGEIMKCCDVGYYMPSNAVAHNEITSVEVAHCGLAGIYIKTLSPLLGCQVTGCHFPDAPIVGDSVSCLMLVGCRVDTWFEYTSGAKNSIICCNIAKGYLYDKENQFSVPSDTQIKLNRGMGDVPDSEVNWD